MKRINIIYTLIVFLLLAAGTGSQVIEQNAVGSRMFYYNSGGLVNQTPELLTPVNDSSCYHISYSMKTLAVFEGVYYQALNSGKFDGGNPKTVFRKSSDGINWSQIVPAGDSPAGESEYYQNIYVWKKNNNINIGITFVDRRDAFDQVRFVRSTNGGASFSPSIQLSQYTAGDEIQLGGLTGRGDTIAACWAKVGGVTMFTKSTDGGATWSAMSQVFSGGMFSICTDITMDNTGTLYTVISEDQFLKVNLIVRKSTNLGATWFASSDITNVSIPQLNQFQQCKFFNNRLYVIWERNLNGSGNVSDGIFIAQSTNGGSNWSAQVDLSDADTLYSSIYNFPMEMHPSFTVTQSGTIYAVWADCRMRYSQDFDSCKFNVYLSRSTNGGANWSPNMVVNAPSNYSKVFNQTPDIAVKSSGGTDSVLVTWTKKRDISVNGITQIGTEIPAGFSLSQNYPNPFNPSTSINFSIPEKSPVRLSVYDILGRETAVLVNEVLRAGVYKFSWDASALPSGIYFCHIKAEGFTDVIRMILIK